mmetsp:Transcript_13221/g.31700  ORF Transcript_13221/g.31700 Transcript_13221/m.31700 type:complete len:82 (+) Transcript_13221:477-722(+)
MFGLHDTIKGKEIETLSTPRKGLFPYPTVGCQHHMETANNNSNNKNDDRLGQKMVVCNSKKTFFETMKLNEIPHSTLSQIR